MNNLCEDELHDRQLMAEIRLVADLMIAAGESAGSLDRATIDELLGVGLARPTMPTQRSTRRSSGGADYQRSPSRQSQASWPDRSSGTPSGST